MLNIWKKAVSVIVVCAILVTCTSISIYAEEIDDSQEEVWVEETTPEETIPEEDNKLFEMTEDYGGNLWGAAKSAGIATVSFPFLVLSCIIFGPAVLATPLILLYEYSNIFMAILGFEVEGFFEDTSIVDLISDYF